LQRVCLGLAPVLLQQHAPGMQLLQSFQQPAFIEENNDWSL
jgi:hypothetical protein